MDARPSQFSHPRLRKYSLRAKRAPATKSRSKNTSNVPNGRQKQPIFSPLSHAIPPANHPIKKSDGGGLNICVLPNGRREW